MRYYFRPAVIFRGTEKRITNVEREAWDKGITCISSLVPGQVAIPAQHG